GNDATRLHIEKHKYCLDLYGYAKALGFRVIEHRLFDYSQSPQNQTALMIIEKDGEETGCAGYYACPACRTSLILHRGHYFCTNCRNIFPVIENIPCLMSSHGILGSKFYSPD